MKELVVISGKGGTGKTSVVASFAALADRPVLADCDVDAADLHLVLGPTIVQRNRFSGGSRARIMPGHCTACGKCEEICRFDAVYFDGPGNGRVAKTFRIDPIACEGCGICAWFCAEEAIEFGPVDNGQWFVSETRFGPMVHAALGIAEENSGKLVSLVRREAKRVADEQGRDLLLVDGSPGIGCPVIASITGAGLVLVVSEPTLSGLHDLGRVAGLTCHFGIRTLLCVNKWDLNAELADEMETHARGLGVEPVGRIRYDRSVTEAQIHKQSLAEYTQAGAGADVRAVWKSVSDQLSESSPLVVL
ncbi:MAG: ATP-binding protein [Pirellulales bacterium]|nr:ATP-binding protein [Pirellulales bacterium]